MITSELQYSITRDAIARFEESLAALPTVPQQGTDVRFMITVREGIASKLIELREQLEEYDRWKASDLSMITVSSFHELPLGLIHARIASGLTQKDLAERVGLTELQILRHEDEYYGSASLQRLRDVTNALGLRIRNDVLPPIAPASFKDLVTKLDQVGVDRDFLIHRLMSLADLDLATGEVPTEGEDAALARVGATLGRVFGWTLASIFGPQPLDTPQLTADHARSEMPAYCSDTNARTYVTYANYLSRVVACASSTLPKLPHSDDAQELRSALLARYDSLSFKHVLDFAWDLGIPVLPLRDRANFHGACWRHYGRNVIVLKQRSSSEARWMFDLLHGLHHAAQQPRESSLSIIEAPETSVERRISDEEVSASQFAADVIFNGSADKFAQQCMTRAGGSVERLTEAVRRISAENDLDVGSLANYMAFRLSWQGINWWDAAQDLQETGADPSKVARDVFFRRFPFGLADKVDSGLLDRALRDTKLEPQC